jgi:hypothetical protein
LADHHVSETEQLEGKYGKNFAVETGAKPARNDVGSEVDSGGQADFAAMRSTA